MMKSLNGLVENFQKWNDIQSTEVADTFSVAQSTLGKHIEAAIEKNIRRRCY